MRASNRNYAATVPFVEALARLGLRHVAISPGSRNTPLAFAFAAEAAIEDSSHHDERSAAFFALGMAKATRTPVALVSTSGTAAAEYLPAIVEARHARVPLIVLTADRPPELREVGAPQSIDQHGMYGRAAKWSYESPVPEANDEIIAAFAALAGRAWSAALDLPAGPVHINMPFRDPMAPVTVPGDVPPDLRAPNLPTFSPAPPVPPPLDRIVELGESIAAERAVVIAGPQTDPAFPAAAAGLAAAAGIPLIADPLSGLRAGHHDQDHVIATGDWLARRGDLDAGLRPGLVLRFGAIPTSKSLHQWLTANPDVPQVIVDEAGWPDPGASASDVLRADPAVTAALLAENTGAGEAAWMKQWAEADQAVATHFKVDFPSEPVIAQALNQALPDGSTLYVASSMPIRLIDAFFRPVDRAVRILGNRGANGIDGFISSALGATLGQAGPAFAFAGDLSLLHDIGALATAGRLEIPLTIVVANNDGGGIFHFLEQVTFPEHFERHLGTPHGLDYSKIAEALGVQHTRPDSADGLADLLGTAAAGPRLIEIRTSRAENADLLRSLWARVAEQ